MVQRVLVGDGRLRLAAQALREFLPHAQEFIRTCDRKMKPYQRSSGMPQSELFLTLQTLVTGPADAIGVTQFHQRDQR
jgi:hypothetical protein